MTTKGRPRQYRSSDQIKADLVQQITDARSRRKVVEDQAANSDAIRRTHLLWIAAGHAASERRAVRRLARLAPGHTLCGLAGPTEL